MKIQGDGSFQLSLGGGIKVSVKKDELAELRGLFQRRFQVPQVDGTEAAQSTSILVVRFRQPGVVVWAPPANVIRWEEPGEVLFVVT